MTRVLLTGGSGSLGRELAPRLEAAGYTVRIMSRRPSGQGAPAGAEWALADLGTGAGLVEALAGAEAVVHAATSPLRRTEEVDVTVARTRPEGRGRPFPLYFNRRD